MGRAFVLHWLNGMLPLPDRGHARLPRRRHLVRLALEGLESRCLPSTVTNLNDAGPGSLREAIASTPAGGTVDFQPGLTGTITLTTGELLVGTDLTIAGPGQDLLSVSGNAQSRVFEIGLGAAVAMEGLTITGGSSPTAVGGGVLNAGTVRLTDVQLRSNAATRGGGLYNAAGSSATLTEVLVSDNSVRAGPAGYGGGLYNAAGSTLTLTTCTLQGNRALTLSPEILGPGGGIYNEGTLTVTASTLSGNSGEPGGAINSSGTLTVTASTFRGNGSRAGGGGIYNTGMLTLTASTLSANSTTIGNGYGRGAGLFNSGTAVVREATFSGNNGIGAGTFGGGIYNMGMLELTSCTLSGNSSVDGGGFYNTATLAVDDCTVSGNLSAFGGGLWNNAATLSLRNTLVAQNRANGTGPDVTGPIASRGHNLIGDGSTGSGFADTDLVGTSDAPIDPWLGPLEDNGGPTPTMAPLLGSPAIAAGDPSDAPATDQRGVRRVVHHHIDIGAYQVQPAPVPSCAVAAALLLPPHHELVNVGLSVHLPHRADPSTQVGVLVYGNDGAQPDDAAAIGPGTLQLRARRRQSGNGRVYLVAVPATDASGQSGVDACAVAVPYDHSRAAVAAVEAEAAAAVAFYRSTHQAPDGYALLGQASPPDSSDAGAGGRTIPEWFATALDLEKPGPAPEPALLPEPAAALRLSGDSVGQRAPVAADGVGPALPADAAGLRVRHAAAGDAGAGADLLREGDIGDRLMSPWPETPW